MDKKNTKIYTDIFRYIEANILQLQPVSFTTDFEKASRNALEAVYGNKVKFITCWFHYCQAVRRKMGQFGGLQARIKNNNEAAQIYQELLALPLLPPKHIYTAFDKIQNDVKNINAARYFGPLIKYFKRQWFKKVSFLY